MTVRLAQETLVSGDASHGTLEVVELDGNLLRLFALREAHRVCTQLQVGAQRPLVLRASGLVIDDSGDAVETRVDAVEPPCDVGVIEADRDRLLDALDHRVRPARRLDVATELLVAVR